MKDLREQTLIDDQMTNSLDIISVEIKQQQGLALGRDWINSKEPLGLNENNFQSLEAPIV